MHDCVRLFVYFSPTGTAIDSFLTVQIKERSFRDQTSLEPGAPTGTYVPAVGVGIGDIVLAMVTLDFQTHY